MNVREVDIGKSGKIQRPGLQTDGPAPVVRHPILDIVMLVHDQAGWADLAIRAVEAHTSNPYRLIIVDSASQEEKTKTMLKAAEDRGHTVIHLAENRSFSAGVNAGIEVGDAKFVCILNDDAIVTEGWDGAMMLDASEKYTGLVGARSNYATGHQGDPSLTGDPPYLVFVCVMLRREIWEIVGPMDDQTFDGFSSEDVDYSWRVVKAGYKLKVSNAFALHAGSRTLATKTGSADGIAKVNQKYNARLIEKWGKDWTAEHSRLKERVLVCTFHAEDWTRVDFMGAFAGLKRSDGVTFEYYHSKRAPIHVARQAIADYATDKGYDILISLDDDAVFPGDLLRRLLSHKKEIVTALAYQRKPPHLPCVFEIGDDGMLGSPMLGIEHTGLRKVDVSGYHCSLLRTSVIKKLRAFKNEKYPNGIRQYYGGFENKVGEDFAFSLNCKLAGIPIYCDTELISGHIGESIVVDENYRRDWSAKNGGQ